MKTIKCKICNKEFLARADHILKGWAKYCSIPCKNQGAKKGKYFDCALCGKTIYVRNHRYDKCKSKLFFCSRKCKSDASRLKSDINIKPPHYGTTKNYRKIAFRNLPNKCNVCGYDKFINVLEVHHKNNNRLDNDLDNLVILCPTHHSEYHYGR